MPGSGSDDSPTYPVKSDREAGPPPSTSSQDNLLPPPGSPLGRRDESRPIVRASGHDSTASERVSSKAPSNLAIEPPLPPPPRSDAPIRALPTPHEGLLLPPPDSTPGHLATNSPKARVPVQELTGGLTIQVENGTSHDGDVRSSMPSRPTRRTVAGNYGHDPDRRWLQGILERHYRGFWCLRYCDPSVEDAYGGKVRLQDDERLSAYRDGDVVGVNGQLIETDGRTPLYRLDDVWLAHPR